MTEPVHGQPGLLSSPSCSGRDYCYAAILAVVTFLLYSNTLQVPWYFDDINNIIEQPQLNSLEQVLRLLFTFRGVAKLTFAMNYNLGGLYLPGFHLVNIFIHSGSAIILYLILKRVFRESVVFPFLSALVFAVHPVQTQAVTYIVQRMTSLSGFFFLLALYFYIRFKENRNSLSDTLGLHAIFCWVAVFLAGSVAVFSKENAIVLPVALLLFDRYFLGGRSEGWRPLLIRILPFTLVPCLFAAVFFLAPLFKGAGMDSLTRTITTIVSSRNLNPLTYFVTQLEVIWIYLRILVVPYGITLDYSYPVMEKILTLRSVVAGTGLAGLLLLAFRLRYVAPRISFGIVWFFLTLAVESSFIPLDPLFVHRLYLPLAGFIIIAMDLLIRLPWRVPSLVFGCVVMSIYAMVTWQRNSLWNDPVAFYEDNLRKAPHSERVRNLLAEQYLLKGRDSDAKRMLVEAIRINPSFGSSVVALSNIYINEKRNAEAFDLLKNGIRTNPNDHEMHNSLGSLYSMLGIRGMAEYHLQKAISLNPSYGRAYSNMGAHYVGLGMLRDAERQYRMALKVSPNDPVIHFNLGLVLLDNGQPAEARFEFNQVLKLDPKDRDLIYNLALMLMRLGDQQSARALHARLGGISREMADKLAVEMKSGEAAK